MLESFVAGTLLERALIIGICYPHRKFLVINPWTDFFGFRLCTF